MQNARWALLWLALCIMGPVGAADRAVILILHPDSASLGKRLALLRAREGPPALRRHRVCAVRWADFAARSEAVRAALLARLPATIADRISLEPLPLLNARLAFLPPAQADTVLQRWQAHRTEAGDQFYRLGDVALQTARDPTDRRSALCGVPPPESAADTASVVLAIIDALPDHNHPWLRQSLGQFYFEPGVSPAVRLRHGTAMLGIYGHAAAGHPLTSDGRTLSASVAAPFRISATLVAEAGPETPVGQVRFVRALHWLVAAEGDRPFPDLLNYAQGNGPLCHPGPGRSCAHDGGTGIARLLDRASADYALLVVKSAGNRRWGPMQTMTAPGATRNGLTLGNMQPFDWQACLPGGDRRHHKLYRTSSVGAAGARLLDLVAPGVHIDTAAPNDGRMRNTGTSPAAAIAGVTALRLMALGLRDPAAIKAVLVNVADTWSSAEAPSPAAHGNAVPCRNDPAAPSHGPYSFGTRHDRSYGWGYLNEARALAEAPHARVEKLPSGSSRCYAVEARRYDKFTLACTHAGHVPTLTLSLLHADGAAHTVDHDTAPGETLLQVSNGRGPGTPETAGRRILRVDSARGFWPRGAWSFALASARPLVPLTSCPGPEPPKH